MQSSKHILGKPAAHRVLNNMSWNEVYGIQDLRQASLTEAEITLWPETSMAFFTSTSKSILSCFSLAIAASMVAFSAFSACAQTQDGTRGVSRGNGTERAR